MPLTHHFQIYPLVDCWVSSLAVGGEMRVNPARKEDAKEGIWESFTVEDLFPSCFQNAFNSS